MFTKVRACICPTAVLLALLILALPSLGAAPQRQLKAYGLNGNPRAADISPDEKLVVTQITRVDTTDDPSMMKSVELAQLWDFRNSRMVAEVKLSETAVAKGHHANPFLSRF